MSGFYVRLGRGVEWTDSPALVPPSDTSFSYAKAPDKLQFSFSLVVPQEALDNWNLASDRLGVNTFGDWSHILDHQFGIKPVWAEISREREGKPTQTTKLDATLFTCDSIPNVGALSILRPTALQNCRLRLAYDLTSETLQLADGDTLEVTLHGELEAWYIHKTHGPQTSRHVIPATEYSRLGVALYRIDETAPQLCTQAPFVRGFGLDLEMLSNKYFVTEESPLAFRVVGWWDALSRVAKFSWTLHRMDYNVGTKLVHEVSPSIHSGTVAVTQFSSAQGCKGEETVLMMDPITVSNAGNVGGPGLYQLIVHIEDNVGNAASMRRVFFYTPNSGVIEDDNRPVVFLDANEPPDPQTNEVWVTETPGGQVRMSFAGTLVSPHLSHPEKNYLAPMETVAGVTAIYDMPVSLPEVLPAAPVRSGITHKQGILRFEAAIVQDGPKQDAVPNLQVLSEGDTVTTSDSVSIAFNGWSSLTDGESYEMLLKATDFAGREGSTKALFRFDGSAPEVYKVLLFNANGDEVTAIADSDLTKLIVKFKAQDVHSGLSKLSFSIYQEFGADSHWAATRGGQTQVPIVTDVAMAARRELDPAQCSNMERETPCICTAVSASFAALCYDSDYQLPLANNAALQANDIANGHHARKLTVEIQATNRAMLQTTAKLQIVVDLTPPVVGTVRDVGGDSKGDKVYVSASTLADAEVTLSLHGFGDKESSVARFLWHVGAECLSGMSLADFMALNHTSILAEPDPNDTVILYRPAAVPSHPAGKPYIATVAAINGAGVASKLVCSSGVSVDVTPPELVEITVERVLMDEGFAHVDQPSGRRYYFVTADRHRMPISAVEWGRCSSQGAKSTRLDDKFVTGLPLKRTASGNPVHLNGNDLASACSSTASQFSSDSPEASLVAGESHVHLQWRASDPESGIKEYRVTALEAESETPVTHDECVSHQPHATCNLGLAQGQRVVLRIVAENNAGQTITMQTGVVVVDTSAPLAAEGLSVIEKSLADQNTLRVKYPRCERCSAVEMALGSGSVWTSVSQWKPCAPQSTSCDTSLPRGPLPRGSNFTVRVRRSFPNRLQAISAHTFTASGALPSLSEVPNCCLRGETDPPHVHGVACVDGLSDELLFVECDVPIRVVKVEFRDPSLGTLLSSQENARSQEEAGQPFAVLYPFPGQPSIITVAMSSVQPAAAWHTISALHLGVVGDQMSGIAVRVCTPQQHLAACPEGGQISAVLAHDTVLTVSWTEKKFVFDHFAGAVTYLVALAEGYSQPKGSDYKSVGTALHTTVPVALDPMKTYRAFVKACPMNRCFQPATSNTFRAVATAPRPAGDLRASVTGNPLYIEASWGHFVVGPGDEVDRYTFAVSLGRDRYATSVQEVKPSVVAAKVGWSWTADGVTVRVPAAAGESPSLWQRLASQGTPLFFEIRAAGKTRRESVETVLVTTPSDFAVSKDLVLDTRAALTPSDGDVDAINSKSLAAMWPSLQGTTYNWSVSMNERNWAACGTAASVACGSTTARSAVTATVEAIVSTVWYYFCVRADGGEAHCSDGVWYNVVPPRSVSLDFATSHSRTPSVAFQVVTTEVELLPHGTFHDKSPPAGGPPLPLQSSGNYQYALGSSPGADDVVAFRRIPGTSAKLFENVHLRAGTLYYATVAVSDLAGNRAAGHSLKPLLVDNSPPHGGIVVTARVARAAMDDQWEVYATWQPFVDEESGISVVEMGIGTQPGLTNFAAFENTTDGTQGVRVVSGLKPGSDFYITVCAKNRAHLQTCRSSTAVVHDDTPPAASRVIIETSHGPALRVNDRVHIKWEPFTSTRFAMVRYAWCVGRIKACDFRGYESVGLHTSIRRHVLLADRGPYTFSVQGCNSANVCSTASSSPVIIDNTPPNAGTSYAGLGGTSGRFVPFHQHIELGWSGFFDDESGIESFTVCVGLNVSDVCVDAVLRRTLGSAASGLYEPGVDLAHNVRYYFQVIATNGAGFTTTGPVRHFTPDTTSPSFLEGGPVWVGLEEQPASHLYASATPTQADLSLVRFRWAAEDAESGIVACSWQVVSEAVGEGVVVDSSRNDCTGVVTASGMDLVSGHRYHAVVRVCNGAGRCISARSQSLLVDATPPHSGSLKDFSSKLYQDGDLGSPTLLRLKINTTLARFWDPESRLEGFAAALKVGTASTASQPSQSGAFSGGTTASGGERFIVLEDSETEPKTISLSFELRRPDGTEYTAAQLAAQGVFLVLIPVNSAGLEGIPLREKLEVNLGQWAQAQAQPNPECRVCIALTYHTCQPEDCSGACTCAPATHPCSSANVSACASSRAPGHWAASNEAKVAIGTSHPFQQTATASTGAIPLYWTGVVRTSTPAMTITDGIEALGAQDFPIHRFQASAGLAAPGATAGSGGLFHENDVVWQDMAGFHRHIVRFHGKLRQGVSYWAFLKVFWDRDTFSIRTSNPVVCDQTPPRVSTSARVLDLVGVDTTGAVDFVDVGASKVYATWEGVFSDSTSGLVEEFVAGVGTAPGAFDVVPAAPRSSTRGGFTVPGGIVAGITYYVSVVAENKAGLTSMASSAGVRGDSTPPIAGYVRHGPVGSGHHSRFFSAGSGEAVEAFWHGFSDVESGIVEYQWAVGSSEGASDLMPWTSAGVRPGASVADLDLSQKDRFFICARAVNGRSLSTMACSPAVTIDRSPPVGIRCTLSARGGGLKSPSFESGEGAWKLSGNVGADDLFSLRTTVTSPGYDPIHPFDGATFAELRGQASATWTGLQPETTYRLSFAARGLGLSTGTSLEVVIRGLTTRASRGVAVAGGADEAVAWQRVSLFFVADDTAAELTLKTAGRTRVGVDAFAMFACTPSFVGMDGNVFEVESPVFAPSHDVALAWSVSDLHSGIRSFKWAAGSVPGGEQYVPYMDVGQSTSTIFRGLGLLHDTKVYLSLLAENNAGFVKVFSSTTPLRVDLSPPEVSAIIHGSSLMPMQPQSVVFIAGANSSVNAVVGVRAADAESGLTGCLFSVGNYPGQHLRPLKAMVESPDQDAEHAEGAVFVGTMTLQNVLPGSRIYAAVVCRNGAGISSHGTSLGATVMAQRGEIAAQVVTPSQTPFEADATCSGVYAQGRSDLLALRWSTPAATGVANFRVAVAGETVDAGLARGTSLHNLSLAVGSHQIQLTTEYEDGMKLVATSIVKVIGASPVIAEEVRRTVSPGKWILRWDRLFAEADRACLRYVVSVGPTPFTSTTLQPTETHDTSYTVISPSFGVRGKQFWVQVTGVNSAGLFTTVQQMMRT